MVDGAKTSEFKSFRSLLEKAARKHCFDNVATSDINPNKSIAMDFKEGPSNHVRSKSAVRRSALPLQDVSPVDQAFLCSPAQLSQKHHEETWTRSTPFPKFTSVTQVFHPSPQIVRENGCRHSGQRHEHKGTFSGKRAILLQLAAGTRSQSVNDFLSSRSDFILEVLQRLGIRRDSNRHDMLQFSTPPDRSDHIVKFCDNSQGKPCSSNPGPHCSLLTWDNNEIHAFPYESSLKSSFECNLWKLDMCNEKGARLLLDFNNPASATGWSSEFDCNKYSSLGKAHTLPNSPCDIDEVLLFPNDHAAYTEPMYKNLPFNSSLDHRGLHEFYPAKQLAVAWNSEMEIDRKHHSQLLINHDPFQADCIQPNNYSSERCFQEESLVRFINEVSVGLYNESPALSLELSKEEFTFPPPHCLVLKDVNHFPSFLNDILGFHDEIKGSSITDVGIYPLSSTPDSLLCLQHFSDGDDHSSIYSDFSF